MVEYVAKNDTVWNFKFYRKGAKVEAGTQLDDNTNFERVDGSVKKPVAGSANTGATISKEDEIALRTRAKELKIASWHNKNINTLLAEIAEAEAKLAAPAFENTGDGAKVEPEAGADGDSSEN